MPYEILINVSASETRVAHVENGLLVDLKVERKTSPTLVGSIHRGKVIRVLPGMQAAFVDIGLDRAAFLYVGDTRDEGFSEEQVLVDEEPSIDQEEESEQPLLLDASKPAKEIADKPTIQDLLHEGQMVLVQVAKDPLGTKGARITMHLSLPGRRVVYMPTLKHLGISRRIKDDAEKERLRDIVSQLNPEGGVIVRTAAEGATRESLEEDLEYLKRLSKEIWKANEKKKSPGLIHAELDVELRAIRDLLDENVSGVYVDDEECFKKVQKFVTQFMPKFKNKIFQYQEKQPLFDLYDIELEISRSMDRKIWLKSGGYIVIDEAEALVVIDVNTGRYVGKKDFEETILKTNLEAAREIAHQLRIRNCGGILIIDFIDMEKEGHREKVLSVLAEELQKDPARTNIVAMSDLGLVEMTRKRIRPSLVKTLCEPCSYCEGKGYIKRKSTIANEIFRALEREARAATSGGSPVVHCHGGVVDWIYEGEGEALDRLELKLGRSVAFIVEPNYHMEQFEIFMM